MQLTLQYVQDHLVHFYHLHALDWVDMVVGAEGRSQGDQRAWRKASPTWPTVHRPAISATPDAAEEVRRVRAAGTVQECLLGHPAYKLPPEANLMAVAHYLEALDFQKDIVKIHAVFGGKNPHPNWLVGGVPCAINIDGTGAVGAINMERLNLVSSIIDSRIEFIDKVYIPDLLAIASLLQGLRCTVADCRRKSVLSYGDIPEHANDYSANSLQLPGRIIDGKLAEVHDVDLARSGANPGVRHPLLVQIRRREQGAAPVGTG